MRLVQFVGPAYPDDSHLFKSTSYYESLGKYVGEYYGTDDTIDDYLGAWPIITHYDPIGTLKWLREDLGEAGEFATRTYAAESANAASIEVGVFLDAIRDRVNDVIIVSDAQYEAGINLIYSVDVIDEDKAIYLLGLGGHSLP